MPTANPSATPAEPIGAASLAALFHAFEGRRGVLLAVSGGADSTAMMLLAARWRDAGGRTPLVVATLDHRLRPGSAAEGDLVAQQAESLALPCQRLAWVEARGGPRLQERARAARYRLLCEAAEAGGCDALATAHTLDDQAETVLMRILRGSGIDGLAAMRPDSALGPLRHLRPLLGTPKSRLVATLLEAGWRWSEDPSNQDDTFERVRIRTMLAGLDPPASRRLSALADRSARASAALDAAAETLLAAIRTPAGLDASRLAQAPAELRLRVLAKAIADDAQGAPVRLERLERLSASIDAAVAAGRPLARTLQGCRVTLDGPLLRVSHERPRRRGRPVNHVAEQRRAGAAKPWQDSPAPLD